MSDTVGPCWLSVLNIAGRTCPSQSLWVSFSFISSSPGLLFKMLLKPLSYEPLHPSSKPSQARLPPSCLLPPDIAELCAGQWSCHRQPPLLLVCAPASVDFVVFTFTLPGPHMMTITASMWLSNNYRERPLWGTRQLLTQAPPSMDFPGKSTRVGCHCLLRMKQNHTQIWAFRFSVISEKKQDIAQYA